MDVSSDYTQVENVIKQVIKPSPSNKNISDSFRNVSMWYLTALFIYAFLMQAQEKLGPVDMLVNCAGTSISGKFEEMEVERFKVSPSTDDILSKSTRNRCFSKYYYYFYLSLQCAKKVVSLKQAKCLSSL